MNEAKINKVNEEIRRYQQALHQYETDLYIPWYETTNKGYKRPINSGALKRASLDLSRALTELRKPI